jgi:hypothetical protein
MAACSPACRTSKSPASRPPTVQSVHIPVRLPQLISSKGRGLAPSRMTWRQPYRLGQGGTFATTRHCAGSAPLTRVIALGRSGGMARPRPLPNRNVTTFGPSRRPARPARTSLRDSRPPSHAALGGIGSLGRAFPTAGSARIPRRPRPRPGGALGRGGHGAGCWLRCRDQHERPSGPRQGAALTKKRNSEHTSTVDLEIAGHRFTGEDDWLRRSERTADIGQF